MAVALLSCALPVHAGPRPRAAERRASPTAFGRVFEQNRAALLRVQPRPPDGPESAGFFLGAQGELLFAAPRPPLPRFTAWDGEGRRFEVDLLAYYGELGLGLGKAHAVDPRTISVLRVAERPAFERDGWLLVLRVAPRANERTHQVEPFAGVVEGEARPVGGKHLPGLLAAPVAAPARVGSPALSSTGELVGVALRDGARATTVLRIDGLMPYLRHALGGAGERGR